MTIGNTIPAAHPDHNEQPEISYAALYDAQTQASEFIHEMQEKGDKDAIALGMQWRDRAIGDAAEAAGQAKEMLESAYRAGDADGKREGAAWLANALAHEGLGKHQINEELRNVQIGLAALYPQGRS